MKIRKTVKTGMDPRLVFKALQPGRMWETVWAKLKSTYR